MSRLSLTDFRWGRPLEEDSFMRKRLERNGGWLVLVGLVWIAAMGCASAQTAAAKADASSDAAFEVATIKPAAPSPDGHTHINYPEGGGFSAGNITLAALMQWAYDMPQKQILEGPTWMESTRFDFLAKTDAATDARLRSLAPDESTAMKRRMVQGLLEDRFALKVHRETRTLPAYDLVVGKDGSKLQPSKSNGKSIGTGSNHFNGWGLTAELIAEQLSEIAGRVVVDKTGLDGRYDLKLKWTPDDAVATEGSPPSLFTAIEEQLGLQLKAAKEPVPVLVIDEIEAPSPN
jgi:uncharacterized protein (TIGR03435 family)